MPEWKLCFVLLLPLTVCFDSGVTLVKTIGREPDETPICTNESIIVLIVCRIRTENEECPLLYRDGHDFKHGCDSRFTLKSVNQTVFLHLTNLTPVDSGSYTCECSSDDGTYILHLNITVEDDLKDEDNKTSSPTQMQSLSALIGAAIVVIILGVILGFIYWRIRHSRQPEPPSIPPVTEPEHIEPYSTFIQRQNGLYSTASVYSYITNTNNSNMFTREDTHAGNAL